MVLSRAIFGVLKWPWKVISATGKLSQQLFQNFCMYRLLNHLKWQKIICQRRFVLKFNFQPYCSSNVQGQYFESM